MATLSTKDYIAATNMDEFNAIYNLLMRGPKRNEGLDEIAAWLVHYGVTIRKPKPVKQEEPAEPEFNAIVDCAGPPAYVPQDGYVYTLPKFLDHGLPRSVFRRVALDKLGQTWGPGRYPYADASYQRRFV